MKISTSLVLSFVLSSSLMTTASISANEFTLDKVNPVVVSSMPLSGSSSVAPSTKEIIVKFSHDMMTENMWSVVKLPHANFPQVTGKVHYKSDARSFVIPVKLNANTSYAFSLNSNKKSGFKGKNGKAALPFIIAFKTTD